jgi:hypothetical protein
MKVDRQLIEGIAADLVPAINDQYMEQAAIQLLEAS